MFHSFLDFLFPRISPSGQEGELVTDAELRSMASYPLCIETAELRREHVLHVDRIIAATTYQYSPHLRSTIQRFKYLGMKSLYRELGKLLIPASALITPTEDLVLCPVPLHWSRKFSRGFNQSELLASVLTESRGWKSQQLLRRTRPTGHQAHRPHEERWDAVRDAFAVVGKKLPTHVVLIDDIATTGATLDACAKVLKESGTQRIDALVIAKG